MICAGTNNFSQVITKLLNARKREKREIEIRRFQAKLKIFENIYNWEIEK